MIATGNAVASRAVGSGSAAVAAAANGINSSTLSALMASVEEEEDVVDDALDEELAGSSAVEAAVPLPADDVVTSDDRVALVEWESLEWRAVQRQARPWLATAAVASEDSLGIERRATEAGPGNPATGTTSAPALIGTPGPVLRPRWIFGASLQRSHGSARFAFFGSGADDPAAALAASDMSATSAAAAASPVTGASRWRGLVWPAGRTAVVASERTDGSGWNQAFYAGHAASITCVATGNDPSTGRPVIATASRGAHSLVQVWDAITCALLRSLRPPHHRGACQLAFSPAALGRATGTSLLASIGLDARHRLVIHDWRTGDVMASSPTHHRYV